METMALIERIASGEDSRHQFKATVTHAPAIAAEMIAFSNSGGGRILIGVDDEGRITGLTRADVGRINQLIANAATDGVRPPIHPETENIRLDGGLVIVVTIADGISKPHTDRQGTIWVKNGADKRRVTAREELQRPFQRSSLVHADEVPVAGSSVADLDGNLFSEFFQRRYGESVEASGPSLPRLLENLRLAENGCLTLAGLLLFARNPQRGRPQFMIKAASYPGMEIGLHRYLDSQDLDGPLLRLFEQGFSFIKRNLHHIQGDQGVNSLGRLEIPGPVFEELLVNALVHRDYFISAPIRLFMFADRVEIISPGHLPNHLNIIHIRHGISNIRNPILASFASHLLPYRGLGTGIIRALRLHPRIDLTTTATAISSR